MSESLAPTETLLRLHTKHVPQGFVKTSPPSAAQTQGAQLRNTNGNMCSYCYGNILRILTPLVMEKLLLSQLLDTFFATFIRIVWSAKSTA